MAAIINVVTNDIFNFSRDLLFETEVVYRSAGRPQKMRKRATFCRMQNVSELDVMRESC